jgi:hypothetical protein
MTLLKTIPIALVVLAGASAAHATFVLDTHADTTNEIRAVLDPVSNMNASMTDQGTIQFTNDLGISVNTLSSFSTSAIRPAYGGGLLTSITLTPVNGAAYSDFSFVAQSSANNSQITISVQDNQGNAPQEFTFAGPATDFNMHRTGIISTDGETIKSITITDSGGFKDIKNFDFSLAVPEPATWSLMFIGVAGIGWQLRRRRLAAT